MVGRASPPHSLVSREVAAALCALAAKTPAGCFVEVGVYHGGTAWHLAKTAELQGRTLYLYDTFTGIPYADRAAGDSHLVGDFKDTSAAHVRMDIPTALVIEGVFPESALDMEPVAFVHLDCDQYQSYRDALDYLLLRMVPGGMIWLDDYECLGGATRAVDETVRQGHVRLHRAEKCYVEKLKGD
jgi:predicted O-methyltransferase YrrM